jgi:hypothetical protein
VLDRLQQNKFITRSSDQHNHLNHTDPDWVRYDQLEFPATVEFFSSDTQERYQHNLCTQPEDWHYRTQPVRYVFNSDGFRTQEISTVDWANSVVLFGCSETMGTGLDESETISAQLQKLTGVPVINMARNGTSMHYAYSNNVILKKLCNKPLAVINHWTAPNRITIYGQQHCANLLPRHKYFYSKYYGLIASHVGMSMDDITQHEHYNARLISESCRLLWYNTRYVETTWSRDTAQAVGCKQTDQIDHARDVWEGIGHSGPQTAISIAQYYAEQLNL